jgi:hypothetical protein
MTRIYMINGVRHGYHDLIHRDPPDPPDPCDPEGHFLLAMCLLQQAGVANQVEYGVDPDLDTLELEFNGLGIYIKMNGKEFWLKATNLGGEDKLFESVQKLANDAEFTER